MSRGNILTPVKRRVSIRRFGGINNALGGNAGGSAYAEFSYNFDISSKTLKSGAGGSKFFSSALPYNCKAVWFYKRNNPLNGKCDDRIIVMTKSGDFYVSKAKTQNFTAINSLGFTSVPIGVCYNYNGEDVIIFATEEDGAYLYDGSSVTPITDAPPISSACIHYERLFATTDGGKTLWFSDDFDPLNWSVSLTEAGFIDMSGYRGEALKVMSFLDYLYVFRTYGITRVSAYGDQTQFAVSDVFVSSGRIHRDSVTYCGDRILFMSNDGFYSFTGLTATKILGGLDGVVDYTYDGGKGQYYNGKAYFCVKAKNGASVYECLLVYDVGSGDYYLVYGLNIADICLVAGREKYELLFLNSTGDYLYKIDESGALGDVPLLKMWQSKFCDFGIENQNKVLEEVSLSTLYDVTLTVSSGERTAVYAISGKPRRQSVKPRIRGDNFSVKIESEEADADISAMSLTFEYYR